MASLLVAMALMAIFMSAALPAWSQMAQREKEAEYLFRANQYALAVARCRLKQCGANGFAPSVDFLVEQRFLRKKYKDPITDKDFVPVFNNQAIPGGSQQAGQAGQQTGQPTGQQGQQQGQQGQAARPGQPSQPSSLATGKSLATDTLRISADTPGGSDSARPLTGVTSSSKATALRLFKGQATTYDQWAVTVNDLGLRLGGSSVGSRFVAAGGTGTPQQPGQQPGQQGQNPFGQGGNPPRGTPPPGGGSGFGSPNQQGTPVFPQQPFGGGTGQKPPSSPFGSRPPL